MRSREYSCRMKKQRWRSQKSTEPEDYRQKIENRTDMETSETGTEIRGTYSQTFVTGAKLALFKAKRVNTADQDKYPKGYYLVKAGGDTGCVELGRSCG